MTVVKEDGGWSTRRFLAPATLAESILRQREEQTLHMIEQEDPDARVESLGGCFLTHDLGGNGNG